MNASRSSSRSCGHGPRHGRRRGRAVRHHEQEADKKKKRPRRLRSRRPSNDSGHKSKRVTLFSLLPQKFLDASNRFHEITHLNGTPSTGSQANNLQVGDVVLVPVPRLKTISAPVRHGKIRPGVELVLIVNPQRPEPIPAIG